MMRTAGQYRVLMHLQKKRDEQPNSEEGALVPNYRTEGEAWFAIEPLSGRELWLAQQRRPEVSHRLRGRWHPSVGEGWQLMRPDDGRLFHVLWRLGEYEGGEILLFTTELRS